MAVDVLNIVWENLFGCCFCSGVTRDVLVWGLVDLFSKPLLLYSMEESL